ncbi:MAG TPA: hydrogenase maturation protease [Solirubrobacteraceae bacterium]|nr:hydrogenase maturation protease [Solirubrobacteraceae bacterium]
MDAEPARRVLIAGVGNVLRRDDGFGPAVLARLHGLPESVRLLESGIGGMALLQELMDGWDGLVLIDAVDRGAAPGTLFAIDPVVAEFRPVPDIHLANPERVLMMARALGVLPRRLLLVGCQPEDVDNLGETLSPAVERAVPLAVETVQRTVRDWLAAA